MAEIDQHLFTNSQLLVDAMGRWPSFHDAQVKTFLRTDDLCEALIHVFEMTSAIDAKGFYVLANHHLVTLTMSDVEECTLPEGYTGDVLFALAIERAGGLVKVTLDSATDPDQTGYILCREANIAHVVPCGPRGESAI